MESKVCKNCGKEFVYTKSKYKCIGTFKKRIFCSKSCSRSYGWKTLTEEQRERRKKLCSKAAKRHGYFGSRVYRIWQGMKNRATNKNDKDAPRYIDRGIDIDKKWKEFTCFLSDMGEPPTNKHSIERVDNNRGYYQDNCVWATQKEQARNKRTNLKITFNGETKCLVEWAEEFGISPECLSRRLKAGPIERAMTSERLYRPWKANSQTTADTQR